MFQKVQDCRLGADSTLQNWGQAAIGIVVSCMGQFFFLLMFLETLPENENKNHD